MGSEMCIRDRSLCAYTRYWPCVSWVGNAKTDAFIHCSGMASHCPKDTDRPKHSSVHAGISNYTPWHYSLCITITFTTLLNYRECDYSVLLSLGHAWEAQNAKCQQQTGKMVDVSPVGATRLVKSEPRQENCRHCSCAFHP